MAPKAFLDGIFFFFSLSYYVIRFVWLVEVSPWWTPVIDKWLIQLPATYFLKVPAVSGTVSKDDFPDGLLHRAIWARQANAVFLLRYCCCVLTSVLLSKWKLQVVPVLRPSAPPCTVFPVRPRPLGSATCPWELCSHPWHDRDRERSAPAHRINQECFHVRAGQYIDIISMIWD